MNLLHKALYIIGCNVPSFVIWWGYSLVYHKKFSWISAICIIVSAFISFKQFPLMDKHLERIPVCLDEMPIRGIDASNVLSTLITYLFLLFPFLPDSIKSVASDSTLFFVAFAIQFLFAMITDNAPVDLLFYFRGYTYRTIKINGTEHLILCKKSIRNKKSIKLVVNPFRGFLIHVKK